jgi:signal transduction histidine kinase
MKSRILICVFMSITSCYGQSTIHFTKFQIFDDSSFFDCNKPIVLDYKPQHIGISFLDSSEKTLPNFEIKLEGSDNIAWIPIGSQGFMSYSNLYGGKYVFTVKNKNNNAEKSLEFTIKAAFWQKWWFIPSIMLYIFTVIGLVFYLFFLYRFRQKMKTMKVQDKIARDLHDDVGSTLSSIAILTQAAKNNLEKAPEKTKKLLVQISENAQETLDNMSDIVWTNKTLNDNFEQLTVRMNEFLGKVLEPKDIDYQLTTSQKLGNLEWTSQKYYDFYMIFKEAINNAAKYSKASHVTVSANNEERNLVLEIIDDGVGFDASLKGNGNGILNMTKRATLIKAKIDIISVKNQGTSVVLLIPL